MFTTINYVIKEKYDNSDYYDNKYFTFKINLHNDLSLEKNYRKHDKIRLLRSVFSTKNKYHLPIFLNRCLYKLSK